jgi:hypothetical protein
MGLISDLTMYARFAWGLHGFFQQTVSPAQARANIERRLAEREGSFLRLVERGVFGYERSPYRPLFRQAQCELGDVQALLRSQGLEATLRALREAGVYVTFEEFKGRRPIERQGIVLPVHPSDFDNPCRVGQYETYTGGSTGAGTRTVHNLEHLAIQAEHLLVTREAHGLLEVPTALWRGILPDGSGINNVLRAARFGRVPDKWFSHLVPRLPHDLKPYLMSLTPVAIGRLHGVPVPRPEWVPLDRAIVVAEWAGDMAVRHGRCLVITQVSRALRVCQAAVGAGIDLTGAWFWISGEPLTPAKVAGIRRSGADCFPSYGAVETGRIGMGCAAPLDATDVHLALDACAIVQYPRQLPQAQTTVPAFYITMLLLAAPKLMLNVELDDYGVMEERRCGCPLERLGWGEHLRGIHSFRKLTGEGVTLVGSEMIRILEEVLPARFGGSPLDYQLLEEEDAQGFTKVSLVVSPRIEIADDAEVIQAVLDALRRGSMGAGLAGQTWAEAGALQVRHMEPVWTARGKLLPLHLTRGEGKP